MKNYLITGGTGFVGTRLISELEKQAHHIYILTRNPEMYRNTATQTFLSYDHHPEDLPTIHGIINLAGDSLFGYWTKTKKASIRSSRMETTERLLQMTRQLSKPPEVWINASAIGFYGTSEDLIFTEETTASGNDFLAEVVTEWEKTAQQATELGIRVVYARFGIILGREDGALPLMSLPVKMFAGTKMSDGEQWMSWIHIEDVVQLLLLCLQSEKIAGPVNFTAPEPKRNKEFTKMMATVLKRPFWPIPAPYPIIRMAIGEMSMLLLKGQCVLPNKAEEFHYRFRYPKLKDALTNLLEKED